MSLDRTVGALRQHFTAATNPSRNLVNMNMAANTKPCLLCGNSATGNNRSSEHIVPAALGGTRTVSGFICQKCNSDAGRSCDTALARSFEGLTRLLDISRKKAPCLGPGSHIHLMAHPSGYYPETVWCSATQPNKKSLKETGGSCA